METTMINVKQLIENKDYQGLENALTNNPALANEGLPYDDNNTTKASPLHRLCDAVFTNKITDEEAVKMADILLAHGADINGGTLILKNDTPLIAAASLHADKVAELLINKGAEINHAGTHGGTALHWAAWCGRDKLVKTLIDAGADINKTCIDFKAAPLFWAVHGLKKGGYDDMQSCIASVKALLDAGADKTIPNIDGNTAYQLLNEKDIALKELLA